MLAWVAPGPSALTSLGQQEVLWDTRWIRL